MSDSRCLHLGITDVECGGRSYAQALLQREMAVQSLQQRMWHEEVEESCVQGAAAKRRRVAAEEEEREAMRELDRVQAEGPANHRKRDPIDKVPLILKIHMFLPGRALVSKPPVFVGLSPLTRCLDAESCFCGLSSIYFHQKIDS